MTATPYMYDRSGSRYPLDEPRWRGQDGSPLMIDPLPGLTPDLILPSERSLWRYQAALPVDYDRRVSLGEGWTPLLPLDWQGAPIHVKPEWFNPTSSFKDRGVSVMVSHLVGQGATRVLEDSSGNGGSSVAAYSAAAGIAATIVVPAATSPAKILQARSFGADVVPVAGTRDEVARDAIRRSTTIPYASHNWHPMFLQGVKTIGYELWEQLGYQAPDNVVVVAGAGSIVLGCDLAFTELLQAGQIDRRPKLLVAQPEQWATIADTVNGIDPNRHGNRLPTIAQGASIAEPVRLAEVVAAVRRSGGSAVSVTETQIAAAVRTLAGRGLYAEPTSAVAAAGLDLFLTDGVIKTGETTALILTGSGLKAADLMADVFATE